jgi:hypothetical protein
MEKSVSIILSPSSANYRKVAQQNWGLTDEQMKGKHVHHHPPVSDGGRNIPEHLYVCSPSLHAYGWHDGDYFIEQATLAGEEYGHLGGSIGGKCPWWTNGKEDIRRWEWPGPGWTNGRDSMGIVGSMPYWNNGIDNKRSWDKPGEGWMPGVVEIWWTNGKEEKKLPHSPGSDWTRGRAPMATNTQKWMCTVTGKISTAGPLTIYQRSVGVDPTCRVKVQQ